MLCRLGYMGGTGTGNHSATCIPLLHIVRDVQTFQFSDGGAVSGVKNLPSCVSEGLVSRRVHFH